MADHVPYTLSFDDLLTKDFREVVVAMYDAIPSHDTENADPMETRFLLGYYSAIYARMSAQWSMLVPLTQKGIFDKVYNLKKVLEQALSVIKFQYDALSRKITHDKDERDLTRGLNR